MQTISLKMEDKLLKDIDNIIKKERYSTRTEFVRDSIRRRLTQLEKDEAIRKLTALKGCMKGKSRNISDEEAGRLAGEEIAKKLGIKLD